MEENLNYIVNAFTKTENNVNLEVDNLRVGCIESKNNNFSLDSEGNLSVKSISVSNSIQAYPIGSIYMSINDSNPELLFGGTWERILDTFLLAAGNTYTANSTGGEATHSLTTDEMPGHYHGFSGTTDGNGNHNHTGNTMEVRSRITNQDSNDTARPITSSANYYGLQITNDSGWHQHTFSGNTVGTGGSQSHNNMPPYLAVYMWKRVS